LTPARVHSSGRTNGYLYTDTNSKDRRKYGSSAFKLDANRFGVPSISQRDRRTGHRAVNGTLGLVDEFNPPEDIRGIFLCSLTALKKNVRMAAKRLETGIGCA
jgi:hypothetical protein